MKAMFNRCINISSLINIDKLNLDNINNKEFIFDNCISALSIPNNEG